MSEYNNIYTMPASRAQSDQVDFAARFRHHVIPQILACIPIAAWHVVRNQHSYSRIFSELWWFCWSRGASFLSNDLQYQLEDFLHQRLLDEIDRQETAADSYAYWPSDLGTTMEVSTDA